MDNTGIKKCIKETIYDIIAVRDDCCDDQIYTLDTELLGIVWILGVRGETKSVQGTLILYDFSILVEDGFLHGNEKAWEEDQVLEKGFVYIKYIHSWGHCRLKFGPI